ncbi:MAG: shikimate kinase [Candidatus Auribacterota bacterium]|nr:shikimate kinase [Candidatus Auribacterota bacterium]
MNIVLFGFMASGKSTIATILSKKLKMEFVEMDDLIEQETGITISKIFKEKGEKYFRAMEREVVKGLASRDNIIISTGGGVILNKDNLDDFKKKGVTISLMVSPKIVLKRTENTNHRPLLNVSDKLKEITNLLKIRKEHYEQADYIIDTDKFTPEEVACKIIHEFKKKNKE